MTESASGHPIDVPRLRAALCKVRQIQGGDLLLFVIWLGLETASHWIDGSRGWATFFGLFAALMLTVAVVGAVGGNRIDDAKAAGPMDAFVAHCRSVLTRVAGTRTAMKPAVFTTFWGLGAAVFLLAAVLDVVDESPPQYLHAAAHVMFGAALFLRPVWHRFRYAPEIARELATLPPPPPPSADLVGRTRDLLAQGQKIQAIKQWREATGAGLAEAKAAVEATET